MSKARPRIVFYDDTDSGITYTGDWFERSGDSFSSDPGWIHGGSQHGATSKNASLTFPFIGTSIALMGRLEVSVEGNETRFANWTCRVDGELLREIGMETFANTTAPRNREKLCRTSDLSEGPHTFTLDVQASEEHPFWVDVFPVRPLGESTSDVPCVRVLAVDEDVQYVSGRWDQAASDERSCRYSTDMGASVLFNFNGTRVVWVSKGLRYQPRGPSRGLYSIDDGPPIPFEVPGLASGGPEPSTRALFETPVLPKGLHQINVTYLGPSAPLVLDYLAVDGAGIYPLGPVTFTLDAPSRDGEPSNPSGLTRILIGTICGGFAFFTLFTLGLAIYLRNRKTSKLGVVPFIPTDDEMRPPPAYSASKSGPPSNPQQQRFEIEDLPSYAVHST
ncbi:hypothetical protein FA15DRAFT_758613 [Coprinopsis marcescibilis]|uniref:Transmembrane protein n=1 Tax=Coprinopsis marcescibilis TaxID=230819 RepID=A0A5C3KN17_COPMA|nr:hypothetical protein FA15DRAFT_758613 [Coprinopsis marcescibilis]